MYAGGFRLHVGKVLGLVCVYRWLQTAVQAAQAVEAAEQREKAAAEAAQAAAAAGFEAEAQAEKLTGVVKQLQVQVLSSPPCFWGEKGGRADH